MKRIVSIVLSLMMATAWFIIPGGATEKAEAAVKPALKVTVSSLTYTGEEFTDIQVTVKYNNKTSSKKDDIVIPATITATEEISVPVPTENTDDPDAVTETEETEPVTQTSEQEVEVSPYTYTITPETVKDAGTYKITVKGADLTGYKSLSFGNAKLDSKLTAKILKGLSTTVKFKVAKATNPLAVSGNTVRIAYSSVKSASQVVPITEAINFDSAGEGKITYKKSSGNSKITVNKTSGNITVKKGLKKGNYKLKIKVKAAGNSNYKASAYKTVTVMIEILDVVIDLPDYSDAEIKDLANAGLSLDEASEQINTINDAIRFIVACGYDNTKYGYNPGIRYQEIEWSRVLSAEFTYEHMAGSCGGTANLFNRLLKDDFDEEGYVEHRCNKGGHVFNYFKKDGVYYFCDFGNAFSGGPRSYLLYKTTDPQTFTDYYLNMGGPANNDVNSEFYVLNLYMYSRNGENKLPCGFDPHNLIYTPMGAYYSGKYPSSAENLIILLTRDGFPMEPVEAPPESAWPAEENIPEW